MDAFTQYTRSIAEARKPARKLPLGYSPRTVRRAEPGKRYAQAAATHVWPVDASADTWPVDATDRRAL